MVKGYKRNVVLLKDTGSDVFDMAYFILRDDVKRENLDIISEANRILEENTFSAKRRRRWRWLPLAAAFFSGAILSSLAVILTSIF